MFQKVRSFPSNTDPLKNDPKPFNFRALLTLRPSHALEEDTAARVQGYRPLSQRGYPSTPPCTQNDEQKE